MKHGNSYLILLITIHSAFNIILSKAISSKDKSLIEAGCKKKDWNENGAFLDKAENKTFNWVANGKLLEKGACLEAGYRSWVVPDLPFFQILSVKPWLRLFLEHDSRVELLQIQSLQAQQNIKTPINRSQAHSIPIQVDFQTEILTYHF